METPTKILLSILLLGSTSPLTFAEEMHTVDTAIRASFAPPAAAAPKTVQAAYTGISLMPQVTKTGRIVVVEHVDPQSPAGKAGIKAGDQVLKINTTDAVRGVEALRDTLFGMVPGGTAKFALKRGAKPVTLSVVVGTQSRPKYLSGQPVATGMLAREALDGDGLQVMRVIPNTPADKIGLRIGDIITKINDDPIDVGATLEDMLAPYAPNDTVHIEYRSGENTRTASLTLEGSPRPNPDANGLSSFRRANIFPKPIFRLAVIGIEFPDVKHNPQIREKDWENSFFSTGTYTTTNATGQTTYGSVNDFYKEVSVGKLQVEGKMFPWVMADRSRAEYAVGNGDQRIYNEMLSKVVAQNGENVLDDYDGVMFIYAGTRPNIGRGNVFWSHRALVNFKGRRLSYFICPEGGQRMTNISVFCHEFGHMLGLPDLYARPENPGSEGMSTWSLMSNQINNGRPQHPDPWSKEQLGWINPVVIDPRIKQKLVLSPIEGSDKQCFKILSRPDGSEYFLLEVRQKTGFDTELTAEGLLIWRVVRGVPILEESHGIDGPPGPRSYMKLVPYPSASNYAFTPFTTPSSKSQLGGGLPVYLTNIERLSDGRISFDVGYEML